MLTKVSGVWLTKVILWILNVFKSVLLAKIRDLRPAGRCGTIEAYKTVSGAVGEDSQRAGFNAIKQPPFTL